jgi:hypothetical protein
VPANRPGFRTACKFDSADALLFHRLGPHKWTEFIRKYMLADVQSPSPEQVVTAMRILRKR